MKNKNHTSLFQRGRCDRAHYDGEYKDKDWMQHLQPAAVFKGGYVIQIEE